MHTLYATSELNDFVIVWIRVRRIPPLSHFHVLRRLRLIRWIFSIRVRVGIGFSGEVFVDGFRIRRNIDDVTVCCYRRLDDVVADAETSGRVVEAVRLRRVLDRLHEQEHTDV